MLNIIYSNRIAKELKCMEKKHKDLRLFSSIVNKIASNQKLDDKYKDHSLKGKYSGYRECHIQPDWLLIYKIYKKDLILLLFRTGSHSDLFK